MRTLTIPKLHRKLFGFPSSLDLTLAQEKLLLACRRTGGRVPKDLKTQYPNAFDYLVEDELLKPDGTFALLGEFVAFHFFP